MASTYQQVAASHPLPVTNYYVHKGMQNGPAFGFVVYINASNLTHIVHSSIHTPLN
jgi:hypothetical protein